MNPPRGVVWEENSGEWDCCWLCEAWHRADYTFLRTIRGKNQTRPDVLTSRAMDLICQECGGRLCTGPHHGTKPCHARQLATKMCRKGWVSVRRYAGTKTNGRAETMATSARVCAEILHMFKMPTRIEMSRYAGTVGPECWTNEVGREHLLFVQYLARVLRVGNPVMARALVAKPEALSEYRAMLNLGATAMSLAKLLDAQFNRDRRGKRRLSFTQLASNVATAT